MNKKLNSLADACVGQTVTFKYGGGSNPGGQRLVEVSANDGTYVDGRDLDKIGFDGQPAYRRFLICLGENVEVVNDSNMVTKTDSVPFVDVQQMVASKVCNLPADKLAQLYNELCHNGEAEVEFVDDEGCFNVTKQAENLEGIHNLVVYDSEDCGECIFDITNHAGESITIKLIGNKDYAVDAYLVAKGSHEPVSLHELISSILNHCDNE